MQITGPGKAYVKRQVTRLQAAGCSVVPQVGALCECRWPVAMAEYTVKSGTAWSWH